MKFTVNSSNAFTNTQRPGLSSSAAAALKGDKRWELALRVAASSEFRKSLRLRSFLLYICEKALTNCQNEIREQQIGSIVFGRRPDFNSSEDNIVRVEARELRRRLDRYFETKEGTESFRIRIPKPGYVPIFEPQMPVEGEQGSITPNHDIGSLKQANNGSALIGGWRSRWIILTLALLVAFLFGTTIKYWERSRRSGALDGAPKAQAGPASIWPLLFEPQRPTNIVVSDCPLVLAQSSIGKRISLKDYADKHYITKLKDPVVRMAVSSQWTSFDDPIIISKIAGIALRQHARIAVRYPSDLGPRDLEDSNLIFLGSSYSDPWITEFDPERNFRLGVEKTTRKLYYQDRSLLPGELNRYYAYGKNGSSDETYGLITFLPNLHHNGDVLILEGTTSEGTEAAGDFITDPYFSSKLREYLGLKRKSAIVPYFELLLKTTMLGGASTRIEVVAHRIIPSP